MRDPVNQPNEVRRKPLASQLRAALAQRPDVWGTAYGYALDRLKWPKGCSAEMTFRWSCCSAEQTAILMRSQTSDEQPLVDQESDSEVETSRRVLVADPTAIPSGWMDLSIEDCATDWLDGLATDADSAFGVAASAWYLPRHVADSNGSWTSDWLQEVGNRISRMTVSDDDSALCHLVSRCELPLLLGTVTGASKRAVFAGAEEAMDNLALLLEQSEDQPAIWLAYGACFLRASLASVLRCRVLANDLGLRSWYPPQKKALTELLNHAVRWCRPNGSQLLGSPDSFDDEAVVWNALLKQTRKPPILLRSLGLTQVKGGKVERDRLRRKVERSLLPEPSVYIEEARSACLVSDWRKSGGRVAIDYSDATIRLEVQGPKGKSLLMGDWTADLQLDGTSQIQLDDWERVCWFSDEDVDYLEIEAKFGEKSRVQRQIILMREDRLLLLADAVLCEEAGNWSLTTTLPLAGGVEFQTGDRTNDAFLKLDGGPRALVMPLAMPEWRREFSPIEIGSSDGLLSLKTSAPSGRQYAPLLVSLAAKHARKPFTWRRLTVAEDLVTVSRDVAAAYRAQIGNEQWLIYRTLAKPARRTAMGKHTVAEFLAARFCGEDAEYETLVEVETGDA